MGFLFNKRLFFGLSVVLGLQMGVIGSGLAEVNSTSIIAQDDTASVRAEAERLFIEANRLVQQQTEESLRRAIKKFKVSLPLWKRIGDEKLEATTLNNIGFIYNALGEKNKALEYYQEALPLRQKVGDITGFATTLNNIGFIYDALGEKKKALEYYRKSLPLSKKVGDIKGEARTLNNMGLVYHSLGEKNKALKYYQEALPLRQKVGDITGFATTLNNIGAVYDSLGEKNKALEYYQEALPLSKEVGDITGVATTLNNIGFIYDALGEKNKALKYYQEALPLRQKVGDITGFAATLNNIGGVYDSLGEKKKALEYYQQALPLVQKVGYIIGVATTLNNIGFIYDSLGEKNKALEYYQQALPLRKKVGDITGVAITLSNIGFTYDSLGEKNKALKYYQEALPLFQKVGNISQEAITLNNIGFIYDSLGEKNKALEYYQEALPLSQKVGNISQEAYTLYNLAFLERSKGNLEKAKSQIEASIAIIEELRTKVASPELRTTYFSTVQDRYQFYIDVLMELHQQNPKEEYNIQAFNASEKSRARTLLELLRESNGDIRAGVSPELLKEEKNLQIKLNTLEKRRIEIHNNPNSTQQLKDNIEKERQETLFQYQDIQRRIRTTSPRYAAITQPQPLTLKQVQNQVLDDDTVLLQYALGEEKSYVFVVTKETFTSHELKSNKKIQEATTELLGKLKNKTRLQSSIKESASELTDLILKPVASQLDKKRILVVADGSLNYIPFNILISPQDNKRFLLQDYEVINSPSSSSLALIREQNKNKPLATKKLAIFADPVFKKSDERVTNPSNIPENIISDEGFIMEFEKYSVTRGIRQISSNSDLTLTKRLPNTKKEAEAILQLLSDDGNSINFYDFDANLKNIQNYDLSDYKIIHLATHGLADAENPELSTLILSLVDEEGNTVNGFLRFHELFNLDLEAAELVILSACETGLGSEIRGEGLVGLTRGFMYAGSPRVLVSLWNVDDEATAEFYKLFYTNLLQNNMTAPEALQATQMEMMTQTKNRRWRNPYFWAAFTIQGEWN